MKAIIIGASGQVGRALKITAPPGFAVESLSRPEFDLERLDALLSHLNAAQPAIVLNAAAYTAVDRAESEPEKALAINGAAVGALAQWCARNGALFVHYSTDYVFDGSGSEPWRETDATGPLSVYGRSKLEGERHAFASGAACLVLRTSWVYAPVGTNFVRTMLRLGRERETLAIVDDQWGAPTLAEDLARATWRAVDLWRDGDATERKARTGLFHLSGGGPATTWKRFAEAIFAGARARGVALTVREVRPVTTAEYGAAAPRPLNSRLDCGKFRRTFDFALPPWENALQRTLEAMDASDRRF